VRGDVSETVLLERPASGAKYIGEFGIFFWLKGDKAEVAWPQDKSFSCVKK
jgi:membrane-bound inhibitor of C-type lysozyme